MEYRTHSDTREKHHSRPVEETNRQVAPEVR
jgi:hypothetical protein